VATTTTEAPSQDVPPGAIAPDAVAFAQLWNENAAGTDVPEITRSAVERIDDGPAADTFLVRLSDRVGLVGVVRNDDGSLAEAILVWIPGGDEEASNQLYRDSFDVLTITVNPSLTVDQQEQLGRGLGLTPEAPPFPAGETVTMEAASDRYTRTTRDTRAADGTALISVVDASPR
jgi:hypothetical protein